MDELTIGFIGYGNMAQAMAQGLVDAGVLPGGRIVACANHYGKLVENTRKLGVRPLHSAQEVASAADMVILAIKPGQTARVCGPIRKELADEDRAVISIVGGFKMDDYADLLEQGTHLICSIPNTPIAVGKGIMITQNEDTLTDDQRRLFDQVFGRVALIERLGQDLTSVATTIAGCAPAYTAMYMEALADAGVKHGLPRAVAYQLAARMAEGTGALYMASGTIPAAMKDAVCSPGGSTIRGVAALEKSGFRGSVIDAIDAIEGS
ncbi:pyrroline-5-carboxylate reductase [uncultured Bifidobacterium sp.]|uniref:pyrroline-5-carboxylate reductase n=1 Tax=uncultured Bifidobacterium sp. TaxID=165187 RepID=UPI00260193AB|nr:pyrroline-5-carboxylate reductase [uncultured Bifidobacterium sp.]